MSWGELREKYSGNGDGGLFATLSDGESIRVVFIGEPVAQEGYFCKERSRSFLFDANKHPGKPRVQFLTNVYDVDAGSMRIFRMGKKLFNELGKYADKGTLHNLVLEIGRRGTALSTQYSSTYDSNVDDALRAKIDALEPHDLSRYALEEDPEPAPKPLDGMKGDEIPF